MRTEVAKLSFFFFQAEDGIRDLTVTGVQTCALPISLHRTALSHPRKGPAGRAVRVSCSRSSVTTPLTLRGLHETVYPAARRFAAHPDFLRRAHLRSAGLFLGRPGTGGGVHGHAGLSVRDHGRKAHALAVLPRVQPPLQRDSAAARRAAVATGAPRAKR